MQASSCLLISTQTEVGFETGQMPVDQRVSTSCSKNVFYVVSCR